MGIYRGGHGILINLLQAAWGLEVNGDCFNGFKIGGKPPDNKKLLGPFLMLMRQKSQWRMPQWIHDVGALEMQEDIFAPCKQRAEETLNGFERF